MQTAKSQGGDPTRLNKVWILLSINERKLSYRLQVRQRLFKGLNVELYIPYSCATESLRSKDVVNIKTYVFADINFALSVKKVGCKWFANSVERTICIDK